MTEQLTSPSNYSINQNALRLNSSSCCLVSPSQSNFSSHLKNNLVYFEQYVCQANSNQILNYNKKEQQIPQSNLAGKKKLTIQIDQNYICSEVNLDNLKSQRVDKFQKNKQKALPNLQKPLSFEDDQTQNNLSGSISLIKSTEALNTVKYYQLLQIVKALEKKCQLSQHSINILKNQNQQKDDRCKKMQQKMVLLQSQLNIKINEIQHSKERLHYVEQKLRLKQDQLQKNQQLLQKNFQRELPDIQQIQQRVRQKDNKLRQLMKINEKLKNLNKDLIRQVKTSEKKVRDLEKQLQNNLCLTTQENIHRLKESSLKLKEKENIERYNGVHSHSHNHHSKQERDSLQHNLNTTKQRQICLTNASTTVGGRKSLERRKNNLGSTSIGQLTQGKKNNRIGPSSSANILHKKLLHK